jgi:ABC-type oligopeptide transport system substrate-binding subunit
VAANLNADGTGQAEPVRPVVAADYVFAIQRACSRETNTPDAFVLYLIEGCELVHEALEPAPGILENIAARAVDDFTLEISLAKPAVQFLTISSMWLMRPVPRELVAEFGDEWQSEEQLITNGPFMLAPGSRSSARTTLIRNPFWPIDRRGNVDLVNVVFMSDEMHGYQLWEAKRLDVTRLPDSETDRLVSESPSKVKLVTDQTVFYLGINFSSGALREPEARRALNAAIDRDQLAETIYGGRALGVRHLAPPGVVGAPPRDEVGKGYDPDYARQQMAQSGFRSCRLMPPITFLVSSSDLSLQQAELIRQMWIDELGCTEEQFVIEQVQFGTLLANTRIDAGSLRPDMWELGWASYYPDSHNWVGDLLHCSDSENRQNRPCSDVDELIHQASGERVADRRALLYRRIEESFFGAEGSEPLFPLYVPGNYELVQSWLTFSPASFGGEQYDSYIIAADLKRLERSR